MACSFIILLETANTNISYYNFLYFIILLAIAILRQKKKKNNINDINNSRPIGNCFLE